MGQPIILETALVGHKHTSTTRTYKSGKALSGVIISAIRRPNADNAEGYAFSVEVKALYTGKVFWSTVYLPRNL